MAATLRVSLWTLWRAQDVKSGTGPDSSMRRDDRAADDAWIRSFLHRGAFGVWATVADTQPLITPNTYVYDESAGAIYTHTASTGQMRSNIEANNRVCFCVAQMGRLLPAATAMEFGVEYASVVVFGRVHVVSDRVEARRALQQLLDKYFPHLRTGEHYRGITSEELDLTAVYRLEIEHWTGKKKEEDAGFPGAFTCGKHL